jgi:formate dehydrogenase major subunit
MSNTSDNLLQQAGALLAQHQPDAALELLREAAVPNDAARCALMAQAYFQRGDARGDVYSSQFYARRALALGPTSPRLLAICAVAALRKELYTEAAELFARYVTEKSAAAAQHLRGLALLRMGQRTEALPWLERSARLEPDNALFAATVREAQDTQAQPAPRTWQKSGRHLGGIADQRPADTPTPLDSYATSTLRGVGAAPKDLDWLGHNIPCQKACPAGTDIPGYLDAIQQGEYARAYQINLHDNVFPGVLGRVCARPCEGECRHGWEGLGEAVAICHSKRAAADLQPQGLTLLAPWFPPTGRRVAVIGSGVAGLAAARNLALLGHQVTVFEKYERPGGMMNQGIPEFRLPRDVIDREIEQVRRQGVEIRCNVVIGRDLTLRQLREQFDAVIMACGTLRPNLLHIPGRELAGIQHGLAFLQAANERRAVGLGHHVVVIGGGFTAMDCARTAARLGADTVELELENTRDGQPALLKLKGESVKVLYRRSQTEMLITPGELEELDHEGIPMHFMVAPVAYVGGPDGRVRAMRFVRTELGAPDASGRRRPVEIAGSDFEVPADTVLLATGQFPDTTWLEPDLRGQLADHEGWLKSGRAAATALPGVFAAGDFATGASSLIQAIGHAKDCARQVDRFLMGADRLRDVALVEDTSQTGRSREMDAVPREPMPMLPLEQRTAATEVEQGLARDGAETETQRCYLCHYKFEIDPDRCIYCDWCIKAKPRPDCILKVNALTHDHAGRIVETQRAKNTEETRLIWINQDDCIRCRACVDACPVDAISLQRVSLRQQRVADGALTADLPARHEAATGK